MNPFLILGMIIAWAISSVGFLLAYLDNREDTRRICFVVGFVAICIAILLTAICGSNWDHLHPS